jgi:hypothetical protein
MTLVLMTLLPAAAQSQSPATAATTSCLTCHADPDFFDEAALRILEEHRQGIHAEAGISCHDCHGGNPDPALADDFDAAMDASWADNPYVGVPERVDIPQFCGRCHSDPDFMRQFSPNLHTDQESRYWTSNHGHALAAGDTRVATCTDCHGVHGMRPATDQRSTVHPTQVAKTCAGCHADAERMASYRLEDGRPIPVDQYARWSRSVHANALLVKEDLSAPTCNDCHGNHGAAPPGIGSVALVCGQCHGREAELFLASTKRNLLLDHEEMLVDAGPEGCLSCHEAPEPAASVTGVHTLVECTTCHGNHGVIRPNVAMLSPLPETPCTYCHDASTAVADEALADDALALDPGRPQFQKALQELLEQADRRALTQDERFDWLVDRVLDLPFHTLPGATTDSGESALRPEFAHLFDKFRIGKTSYQYEDPVTGQLTRAPVTRCSHCHAEEPLLADAPVGYETAREISRSKSELTVTTASAERILLAARRGGVEVKQGLLEAEQAVSSQIGLEALIHTFSTAPDGPFAAKQAEGMEHARQAIAAGQSGMAELSFRRRGLAATLVVIVALLIGLGLKIRQLSASAE